MATAYSYTTLKSTLISFLEDTGTEYAAAVDLIIPLAEDKILRDLDLEIFDVVATGVTAGAYATKPTGYVALRTLHYATAAATGTLVLLEPKSYEFIKDYWPTIATTTTTPKYYTDYSDTQWLIAGTPATALTWTSRYIKRPAGLSGSTATTWLGTNVGDLLFYACLVVSEQFLKADARIATWKTEYLERLGGARNELRRDSRADYSPLEPTP